MMYDVVRAARKRDPFGIDVKDFAGHMAPFFSEEYSIWRQVVGRSRSSVIVSSSSRTK